MNTAFITDLMNVNFELDGNLNRLNAGTCRLRYELSKLKRIGMPNKLPILARFISTKGQWKVGMNGTGHYVNIKKTEEWRLIHMKILRKRTNGEWVLQFIGGPTGYESYYIGNLIKFPLGRIAKEFCICGGAINNWPQCTVNYQYVMDFIKNYRG